MQFLPWTFGNISARGGVMVVGRVDRGRVILVFISLNLISSFTGPESDHWECSSVTHSLTNSLPFSKLD